jgi:hypothetical protein
MKAIVFLLKLSVLMRKIKLGLYIIFLVAAVNILVPKLAKASCITDYSAVDGNLIPNPYFECDEDANGIPDGWSKNLPDANHALSYVDDPLSSGKGKVIKSQFINGTPTDFGWIATNHISLLPNTWYELKITYLLENTGLNLTANEININSNWIGAAIFKYSQSNILQYFPQSNIFLTAPHFDSWDVQKNVYRTFNAINSSGWQSKTIYFKTSQFDNYGVARTFNYPLGTLYIAEYGLKITSGNIDPENVSFVRSGNLNFFKYKGNDFFPIILSGFPKSGGQDLSLDLVKAAGFNTVPDVYRSMAFTDYQALLTQDDLAVMVSSNCLPWSNEHDCYWANDPGSAVNYLGYGIAINHIDEWKNYANNVLFNAGLDEMDCNPQYGATYIGYLDTFANLFSYIRSVSSLPIYGNFCGVDSYTNDYDDKLNYYLTMPDVFSQTVNTPTSYDVASGANSGTSFMPSVGYYVRKNLYSLNNLGFSKKALAYGLGTYNWSSWNGNDNNPNSYIPYNLQRFQVWDQIINGATGALFFVSGVNLDNSYYLFNYNQFKSIASELNSLTGVLLEPEYFDEWNVSNSNIDIMMKKHAGKIYLFAASKSPENLQNIRITLSANYKINSIMALNDITNGDFTRPADRIIIPDTDNSFLDNFNGEDSSSPQGHDAPGYGVHIYEITYQLTQNTTNSLNSFLFPSSPICTDFIPQGKAPWLFGAIPEDTTSIRIYFTEASLPVTHYALVYGTNSGDYHYGVINMGLNERNQMSFKVKALAPGTNYYFKIMAINGCSPGNWSNEISAKTN